MILDKGEPKRCGRCILILTFDFIIVWLVKASQTLLIYLETCQIRHVVVVNESQTL